MLPEYDFSDGVRGKYAAFTDASPVRRAAPPVAIRRIPGQRPLSALTKAEIQALLEDEEVQSAHKAGAPRRGGGSMGSVSAPAKASEIFTVAEFEEIMRKHGAVPLTAAERKKYAKFLKRQGGRARQRQDTGQRDG